jgi:hypothetical protein
LAENLAEQLDLEALPGDDWDPRRGPNASFRRYLRRQVLGRLAHGELVSWRVGEEAGSSPTHQLANSPPHLVWALDEIDRLFSCPFATEVFGLFRSWHDERAFEPEGPWAQLTLAIAYSTEAHLFITDVNQSPFNVGTRLALEDFTLAQIAA